jgi:hypothetical protein
MSLKTKINILNKSLGKINLSLSSENPSDLVILTIMTVCLFHVLRALCACMYGLIIYL